MSRHPIPDLLVDDTVRDILYALRTCRRAPLAALTIVSTVALGLSLVTVAFTLLNALLFRADQVPDVHEMSAVERRNTAEGKRARVSRARNSTRSGGRPASSPTPTRSCPMSTAVSILARP